MEIPLFLARTAGELAAGGKPEGKLAWMACHFSAYGTGLSNLPKRLPEGSMLMLTDRMPVSGHDPERVARQLCETAQALDCNSILLDLQQPGCPQEIIKAILEQAPCPVGVSALYAEGLPCPVLVPPVPAHIPLEEALSPWSGREIWLELSGEGTQITVTPEGSRYTPLPDWVPAEGDHQEVELHCHYQIRVSEQAVQFYLGRTREDQQALLTHAASLGVTRGVGLWQELGV